ncbi:S-layer homology domain-containing protein [Paenibacillus humicus]|uniref:S-layer homology domain-containing protein n=1 Tax=Paenibacillus humicus TaxID=412861 RepID=UPI003F13C75D
MTWKRKMTLSTLAAVLASGAAAAVPPRPAADIGLIGHAYAAGSLPQPGTIDQALAQLYALHAALLAGDPADYRDVLNFREELRSLDPAAEFALAAPVWDKIQPKLAATEDLEFIKSNLFLLMRDTIALLYAPEASDLQAIRSNADYRRALVPIVRAGGVDDLTMDEVVEFMYGNGAGKRGVEGTIREFVSRLSQPELMQLLFMPEKRNELMLRVLTDMLGRTGDYAFSRMLQAYGITGADLVKVLGNVQERLQLEKPAGTALLVALMRMTSSELVKVGNGGRMHQYSLLLNGIAAPEGAIRWYKIEGDDDVRVFVNGLVTIPDDSAAGSALLQAKLINPYGGPEKIVFEKRITLSAESGATPSPSPDPGASPTPGPGTSPSPDPGASPTPGPGTSPSPDPGASPTPGPGTSPSPDPGASPTPAPTPTPDPGTGGGFPGFPGFPGGGFPGGGTPGSGSGSGSESGNAGPGSIAERIRSIVEQYIARIEAIRRELAASPTPAQRIALIREAFKAAQEALDAIAKINLTALEPDPAGLSGIKWDSADALASLAAVSEAAASVKSALEGLDGSGSDLTKKLRVSVQLDAGSAGSSWSLEVPQEALTAAQTSGIQYIGLAGGGAQVSVPVDGRSGDLQISLTHEDDSEVRKATDLPLASGGYSFKVRQNGQASAAAAKPLRLSLPVSADSAGSDLLGLVRIRAGRAVDFQAGTVSSVYEADVLDSAAVYAVVENKVEFTDLANAKWAETSIQGIAAKGIMTGVAAGKFDPSRSVTRAEIAKMIVRAFNLEGSSADIAFKDVKATDWFAPYVAAAVASGITNGRSSDSFAPGAPVSRQELAVMVTRAMQAAGGYPALTNPDAALAAYKDQASVAASLRPGVALAAQLGIVGSGGVLQPAKPASRAEAAVILYRTLKQLQS